MDMQRFLSVVLPPLLILAGCATTAQRAERYRGMVLSLAADEGWQNASDRLVKSGKAAVPFLSEALKNPDEEVRTRAAICLGRIGGRDGYGALSSAVSDHPAETHGALVPGFRILIQDADLSVVTGAAWELDRLGIRDYRTDPAAISRILPALTSRNLNRRTQACEAAQHFESEEFVEPLVRVLSATKGPLRGNHHQAAKALGATRSKKAVPALLRLMTAQGSASNAARALAGIGDTTANAQLMVMLAAAEDWQRRAAAYALGSVDNTEAIPVLAKHAIDPAEDHSVRMAAIGSLGDIKSPEAVPALSSVIENAESQTLRRVAISALGRIACEECLRVLIKALGQRDRDTVMAAVHALGDMKDKRAVPALLSLFDRPDAAESDGIPRSNGMYYNIANAAHYALAAIMGFDPMGKTAMRYGGVSGVNPGVVRDAWKKHWSRDNPD